MIKATYVDHMGSDLSVVNAARVSFGKKSEWEVDYDQVPCGLEMLSNRDTKLINYLAKHKHISPFGHAFASFHVKAPIFVARQLVKHKFLRWNEISRRYVDDEPEFYRPEVWRGKAADKKQGSEGVVTTIEWSEPDSYYDEYYPEDKAYLRPWESYEDTPQSITESVCEQSMRAYNILLEGGVAPEQARMVLPQSVMTEWYWSGSLDAFADMCRLRCKEDTQYETRIVADQINEIMKPLFPVSWEALLND
jgi:thymidylate synthase (FAD)